MDAAAHPPCKSFSVFLAKLLRTVRINIGECAAASYRTLTIAAASDILMFNSEQVYIKMLYCARDVTHFCFCVQETLAFIEENYPHWEINNNIISLCSVKVNKSEEIPAMKLISQTLSYASELERIV